MNTPSHQPIPHQDTEALSQPAVPPVPQQMEEVHAEAAVSAARPAPQKPEGLLPPANENLLPPLPAREPRPNQPDDSALMPHPLPKPKPVQAMAPEAANDTHEGQMPHARIVTDDAFKKAEENLAAYIGSKISPELTDGLVLTLKEHPLHDIGGIELCFQGPLLKTNSGIMGEQVIAALKEHPVFAALFEDVKTTPRFSKPTEPGKEDMLHVDLSWLSAARYADIIQKLTLPIGQGHGSPVMAQRAEKVTDPETIGVLNSIHEAIHDPSREVTDPAELARLREQLAKEKSEKPQHEQIMAKATSGEVKAAPAANDRDMGVVKAEAVPSPQITAPVAALEKAANDNDLAVQGVAR